jgi:signal transduction histidine kinase
VVRPLLIHCDLSGRVVWMSDVSGTILYEPDDLLNIMRVGVGEDARLWRVWQSRESAIFATLPASEEADVSGGLALLQRRLMLHLLRLVAAERRLFLQARPRRSGGGRKAVRQMELERRRLSRELHTGVGQALAAIGIQLELVDNELPSPPERVRHALHRIGALAANTLEQVRSISKNLHPPEWQRLTLDDALRQLWEISGVAERFDAVLQLNRLPCEPDLEVKVLLYRTAQEGLSNLIRHARATRVSMSLEYGGDRVSLTIRDNGVGFDVERLLRQPAGVSAGIGLRSIREQAEALGGTMSVESGSSGTKLIVSVTISPVEG